MSRQPRSGLRKRRFQDLNQPGAVFVKLIGVLLVLLPLALYAAGLIASEGSALRALAWSGMRWSLAAGALLLAVLVVLIVIEQVQEHYFDAQYRKQRDQKLPLGDGYYECQHCGNRRVRASDNVQRLWKRVSRVATHGRVESSSHLFRLHNIFDSRISYGSHLVELGCSQEIARP